MTLPYERTRAVNQTREFLEDLRSSSSLPEAIRNEAKRLLRHYPMPMDMTRAAEQELRDRRYVIEPVFGISEPYP